MEDLIGQIVLQMPTVAILLYILIRFESLIARLITVLIELASNGNSAEALARLEALRRKRP